MKLARFAVIALLGHAVANPTPIMDGGFSRELEENVPDFSGSQASTPPTSSEPSGPFNHESPTSPQGLSGHAEPPNSPEHLDPGGSAKVPGEKSAEFPGYLNPPTSHVEPGYRPSPIRPNFRRPPYQSKSAPHPYPYYPIPSSPGLLPPHHCEKFPPPSHHKQYLPHHSPYLQPPYPRFSKCVGRGKVIPFQRRGSSRFSKNTRIGFVFSRPEAKTVAFYAFYNAKKNDWFYTSERPEARDALNRGYEARGIAGWIYPDELCGSIPLYRLYYELKDDHYYTTSLEDARKAKKSGWSNDGPVGYIFG